MSQDSQQLFSEMNPADLEDARAELHTYSDQYVRHLCDEMEDEIDDFLNIGKLADEVYSMKNRIEGSEKRQRCRQILEELVKEDPENPRKEKDAIALYYMNSRYLTKLVLRELRNNPHAEEVRDLKIVNRAGEYLYTINNIKLMDWLDYYTTIRSSVFDKKWDKSTLLRNKLQVALKMRQIAAPQPNQDENNLAKTLVTYRDTVAKNKKLLTTRSTTGSDIVWKILKVLSIVGLFHEAHKQIKARFFSTASGKQLTAKSNKVVHKLTEKANKGRPAKHGLHAKK